MSAGANGETGSATTPRSSDFRVRTLSAFVLMPPALIGAYAGGIVYAAGVAVLGYLILMEWSRIVAGSGHQRYYRFIGLGLVLALVAAGTGSWYAGLVLMGCSLALALALSVRITGRAAAWLAAGVVYTGAACFCLILLRQGEQGWSAVLFLLTIVWATDIAAYLIGRSIGGPKLWPAISPKKTWSGSIGGLVFGIVAAAALLAVLDVAVDFRIVSIAALLSVATQIGDLFESAFKRAFSVKDSGKLIPGHGGVLDRVDGLLVAAIVAVIAGGLEAGLSEPSKGLIIGF